MPLNIYGARSSASPRKRLTTDALVRAVKEFPCLYYSEHPYFKNTPLKRECWKKIGANFGVSGSVCQSKFKNAKDTYKRAKNAMRKAMQRQHDVKHERRPWQTWQHFDVMKELLDSAPAPTESEDLSVPIAEADDDSGSIQSFGSITISYEPDLSSEEKPAKTESTEPVNNCVVTPARKTEDTIQYVASLETTMANSSHKAEDADRDLSSLETTMANSMAKCMEHLKMLQDERKESGEQKDTIYHFCMYVASCIRELNRKDQLEAMQEIYTVIHKYQKRQLENT
uniref:Protein containing MADF and GT1 domain n=1 Tax=Rhipicephalus zambeziensis TaxID=60191 RepID=A0A224Y9W4_9ACAR